MSAVPSRQSPPQAPAQPSRMKLTAVTRGKIERPMRVLLYGVEGVGKSTFAANAPSPIFLAAEDGTSQLDVARFPEPKSWRDAFDALDELITADHDFRTVVVDTLDWLEPMCWQHVVNKANSTKITSIEDFGFGKGYVAALDEWRLLLAKFEQLRLKRGMHVIFLAHSWIKTFKNPEDADFDRYELAVHAKASGLIKQWCDAVLFARYETFANTDEKTKRTRGVSTGARIIHTQRTAAWDAKNRHDLPDALPLDWQAFADAVAAHKPADPQRLRTRIETLLKQTTNEKLITDVTAAVAAAGDDAAKLAKYADTLAARISISAQENAE
jgi:hypothetical protein